MGLGPLPRLAVVTGSGELDPASRLFGGEPPLVLTSRRARERVAARLGDRAEVRACGTDRVDVAAMVADLRADGLGQVLCEGGPALLGDLLRAGLVDELCCTLSPVLAGTGPGAVGGSLPCPVPLSVVHCLVGADALLLRYRVGG